MVCVTREHGHEAAVAPAGEADARGVDGQAGFEGVEAGEDIAEVAVAEVFDVGLGEGLALAEAAARVGFEDEVTERGKGDGVERGGRKVWRGGVRWAAVDGDDERVFAGGVVVRGIDDPALDVAAVAGVVDGLGAAPCRMDGVVQMGDLLEVVEGAGVDLGRVIEGGLDEGDVVGVRGADGKDVEAGDDGRREGEVDVGIVGCGDLAGGRRMQIECGEVSGTVGAFGDAEGACHRAR